MKIGIGGIFLLTPGKERVMQDLLVLCDNLIKIYKVANLEVVALQGLNLEVARGEMVALVGASGSGKSTLLNILGGLDTPSAGRVAVADYDLTRLNEERRTRYRSLIVGHVWRQSGRNLLPDLSIAENIALPQLLNGVRSGKRKRRTEDLLEIVGLAAMAQKRPSLLSGGEQQRAALAVALANDPLLLLADEPTGELDSVAAQELVNFIGKLNSELGITVLIVTHDLSVASMLDRTLAIRDGRTSTETIRRSLSKSAQVESIDRASIVLEPKYANYQALIAIDAMGLLQLPDEAMEHVALRGRTDVRITSDHIQLWPAGLHEHNQETYQRNRTGTAIGLASRSRYETILVDRLGRLQLPRPVLEYLPFTGQAHVRIASYHVELWPVNAENIT